VRNFAWIIKKFCKKTLAFKLFCIILKLKFKKGLYAIKLCPLFVLLVVVCALAVGDVCLIPKENIYNQNKPAAKKVSGFFIYLIL
jgi:hypothetical protein